MVQDIKNCDCVHEKLLQEHSLKIASLEQELVFKKEKLDDLKADNKRMEEKLDEIKESLNKITIASKNDDDRLDKRLLKIETRLATQEKTQEKIQKETKDDFNLKLGIVTVIFIVLTFYFNFIHHL